MKLNKISMVAMDLDGTLLGRNQQVSEENRAVLAQCRKKGIHVVLASGRSFESTRTFANAMGIECGIISCNGARLDASAHGATMMEDCIPEEIAKEVFEELKRSVIYFECYTRGKVYMTNGFVERFHSHEARVLDLDGYQLEYIDSTERMQREALDKAYKFVVFSPDPKALEQVAQRLRHFDIDITSSWGDNIELMKKGAGKGNALREYARHFDIQQEEIMSFGDQLNDMDMLRASGCPVAMENAVDELKAIAHLIAPHHDVSGVGKTIRKYVLNGEDIL